MKKEEGIKAVKPHKIRARYLTWPMYFFGAGNGIRTRDFNLGNTEVSFATPEGGPKYCYGQILAARTCYYQLHSVQISASQESN